VPCSRGVAANRPVYGLWSPIDLHDAMHSVAPGYTIDREVRISSAGILSGSCSVDRLRSLSGLDSRYLLQLRHDPDLAHGLVDATHCSDGPDEL
jgi:hypothetical protein